VAYVHSSTAQKIQDTPTSGCPSPSTPTLRTVCRTPPRPRWKRSFLDPAVDTPLTEASGNTARALSFSTICRTFSSGGTRIRPGDTMIFSHIPNPLGMRKTRVGKRIYIRRVPLDTIWSCPYCCATVDTASVTLRATQSGTYTLLPCLVYWLLRLSAIPQETHVSGGSHKETCGLHHIPRYPCQLRRLANWGRDLLTQLRGEPRKWQADEQTRIAVLISLRVCFCTF
jgi:hypothetical protein